MPHQLNLSSKVPSPPTGPTHLHTQEHNPSQDELKKCQQRQDDTRSLFELNGPDRGTSLDWYTARVRAFWQVWMTQMHCNSFCKISVLRRLLQTPSLHSCAYSWLANATIHARIKQLPTVAEGPGLHNDELLTCMDPPQEISSLHSAHQVLRLLWCSCIDIRRLRQLSYNADRDTVRVCELLQVATVHSFLTRSQIQWCTLRGGS